MWGKLVVEAPNFFSRHSCRGSIGDTAAAGQVQGIGNRLAVDFDDFGRLVRRRIQNNPCG